MANDVECEIYFNRPDLETWALARMNHSLMLQIQDSPFWEKELITDIPLTEEQMIAFVIGYAPDWNCRYAPFMLGGWFYITRSGYWGKKIRYKKGTDDLYHVIEHYTTEKEKEHNLLMEVIIDGYFSPRIYNERLRALFQHNK